MGGGWRNAGVDKVHGESVHGESVHGESLREAEIPALSGSATQASQPWPIPCVSKLGDR
jgi:hypothetical protein